MSRVTGFGTDHNAALVRLAITSRLAPVFGTPSSTTRLTLAGHGPRRRNRSGRVAASLP